MPIKDFIISTLNIDNDDIEEIDINIIDEKIVIDLKLKDKRGVCPYCDDKLRIKDHRIHTIKVGDFNHKETIVRHKKRRYTCKTCHKTLTEKSPLCLENTNISWSTIQAIMDDLSKYNETYLSIAKRHHVSSNTILKYMDSFLVVPRLPLNKSIGIDEIHSKSLTTRESSYLAIITDNVNRNLLEVLPSRSKDELRRHFSAIPKEERLNVKYVTMDLWTPYRDIANIYLPNAKVCADPFHVVKHITKSFNDYRVYIMNKQVKFSKSYYLLKTWWKLLVSDSYDFNPNKKASYNKVLGQYVNYYNIRNMMLEVDVNLKLAYDLKEHFRYFIKNTKQDEADLKYDEILKEFIEADLPIYREFVKLIKNWKKEIVNSFDRPFGDNKKQTNALTETINGNIDKLLLIANGLTNYKRTRARLLYIFNDKVNYSISSEFRSNKNKGKSRGKYNKK